MTVHAVDFGKSAVDLQSHVAFILDTNVVVAFLREDNPKHLAVHHFLHYLVNQDLQLFVTETVVHEVIHVLSRFFYAQSMLAQNHEHAHYSPAKQRELISRYERQFMSATKQKPSFTPAQKQTCRDILRQYNTLALRAFLPFLNEFCGFLPSSTEQMNIALELCVETPLHSSDAMIAAAASHDDFGERIGLITLDRDMTSLTGVNVYFTEVNNHQYDLSTMREQLGLAAFSFDT